MRFTFSASSVPRLILQLPRPHRSLNLLPGHQLQVLCSSLGAPVHLTSFCANSSSFANTIRPKLQELSQLSAARMEETSQQEKIQEVESKNQNEEEGGIRRRLRDRELLRKRKAEAEEKETNQVESQRKRSRGENKSGAKRRGRPRKTDPVLRFPVIQEEAGDPSVVVVPVPAGVIPGQILGSQTQGVENALASLPVLELVQNSVFENLAEDSAPVPVQESAKAGPDPLQAPYAGPVPVEAPYAGPVPVEAPYAPPLPVIAPYAGSVPVEAPYAGPGPVEASYAVPIPVQAPSDFPVQLQAPDGVPVQFLDAVPVRAPSRDVVPSVAPPAPSASARVETLYTESPGGENPDQVLIEDLGPDDEDDICLPENNGEDEDEGLDEMPLTNTAEQNKTYPATPLPGHPLPQQYLPGNPL